MKNILPFAILLVIVSSCSDDDNNELPVDRFTVDSVFVNNNYVPNNSSINSVDYADVEIRITFSDRVDTSSFNKARLVFTGEVDTLYSHYFHDDSRNLVIRPIDPLMPLAAYRLSFDSGQNMGGTVMNQYTFVIRTQLDSTPKFPLLSDDELLTLVQEQTFRYFWDYAHPVSGLARERLGSGEMVTTGGSGFGLMAIITGIERNFITRQEGFDRLSTIVSFLMDPETEKYNGAFPHWLNGTTGKTIPFSTLDDGGDLVETALLMQGLLTVKEYFKNGTALEQALGDSIQVLWEGVDWNWYRKNDENVLFWHYSLNHGWEMNHQIRGWNEALIVYVLAAASPTHSIHADVYHQGWARNGNIRNGKSFYDILLPLGEDLGGPLFFAHYSFLGLDPRNLSDQYADYFIQNTAHALINYEYCIDNPRNYVGYSEDCWGLTASDIESGYTASSPTNDRGVIAPTAALSSFPYTPVESMDALKFFYYVLGDRIWGEYGFHDAFNLTTLWFASSYLAIDQGPVICMIENYRTGLLWNLFMSNEDVRQGLDKLSFEY
ncbi:MAG: glucoamylase family protein [Bacteroidales bacterium]